MLDPNMQQIIDTVSALLEQRRKKDRAGLTASTYERVGMGSPQIAELDRESKQANTQ